MCGSTRPCAASPARPCIARLWVRPRVAPRTVGGPLSARAPGRAGEGARRPSGRSWRRPGRRPLLPRCYRRFMSQQRRSTRENLVMAHAPLLGFACLFHCRLASFLCSVAGIWADGPRPSLAESGLIWPDSASFVLWAPSRCRKRGGGPRLPSFPSFPSFQREARETRGTGDAGETRALPRGPNPATFGQTLPISIVGAKQVRETRDIAETRALPSGN